MSFFNLVLLMTCLLTEIKFHELLTKHSCLYKLALCHKYIHCMDSVSVSEVLDCGVISLSLLRLIR